MSESIIPHGETAVVTIQDHMDRIVGLLEKNGELRLPEIKAMLKENYPEDSEQYESVYVQQCLATLMESNDVKRTGEKRQFKYSLTRPVEILTHLAERIRSQNIRARTLKLLSTLNNEDW